MKRYRRDAEQGDAAAQYRLGFMYAEGRGVPQDDDEALEWYRRAADQGYAAAQDNLGFMYDEGRGVPQDYTEAVKWYRRAADQGYGPAQYNLGASYGPRLAAGRLGLLRVTGVGAASELQSRFD